MVSARLRRPCHPLSSEIVAEGGVAETGRHRGVYELVTPDDLLTELRPVIARK